MDANSRQLKVIVLAIMTTLLLLTVVVTYLSTAEFSRNGWLFENKNNSYLPWNQRGNVKDSGLTPARVAFNAWAVIYVYQAVMLIYSWSLVFRLDPQTGNYLCTKPGLLPVSAMVAHSVGSVFNSAWTFLADRVDGSLGVLVPQTFAIFLIFAGVAACIIIAYRELKSCATYEALSIKEQLLFAGLWLNANGLYVGWLFVASFLNLDIAIINLNNWPVMQSSCLTLMHLAALSVAYVMLDLFYLKLYLLYTPYFTTIWGLATSAGRNFSGNSANTVFSIELCIVLIIVLIVKFVLAVRRYNSGSVQPLFQNDSAAEEDKNHLEMSGRTSSKNLA